MIFSTLDCPTLFCGKAVSWLQVGSEVAKVANLRILV